MATEKVTEAPVTAQQEPSAEEPTIVCSNPADCCRELTRVWRALGIGRFTGKSAHKRVAELKAQVAPLKAQVEQLRALTLTYDQRVKQDADALDRAYGELATLREDNLNLQSALRAAEAPNPADEAEVATLREALEFQRMRADQAIQRLADAQHGAAETEQDLTALREANDKFSNLRVEARAESAERQLAQTRDILTKQVSVFRSSFHKAMDRAHEAERQIAANTEAVRAYLTDRVEKLRADSPTDREGLMRRQSRLDEACIIQHHVLALLSAPAPVTLGVDWGQPDGDRSERVDMLPATGRTGETPTCHICGKPATCIGLYETCGDDAKPEPACDACCGHSWCKPIVPATGRARDEETTQGKYDPPAWAAWKCACGLFRRYDEKCCYCGSITENPSAALPPASAPAKDTP